jgi:hypothetical protein
MKPDFTDIKIKGKVVSVPSLAVGDKTVVVTGSWLHIAEVHDEVWIEDCVVNPESVMSEIRQSGLDADIFTFAEKIPQIKPRFDYHMEWDNVAAIPITSYEDWWNYVSTDMRKDVKRARSRGVVTKVIKLDDEVVQGIMDIHNDAPTRQGARFCHYGKGFETVKRDYSSYGDTSDFIGAYLEDELIGIIKIVYVGELACMMQILSKTRHNDKRPTNALIAKAVELCAEKGKSYLTYGRYFYGNKQKSSLVDFKRRNGFERILFPRYYVPLTLKGRLLMKLKLHLGLLGILPGPVISYLVHVRSAVNAALSGLHPSEEAVEVKAEG